MSVQAAQALGERLKATDPIGHKDCIERLERLGVSAASLRQAIDRQVNENQILSTRLNCGTDVQNNLVQLGRTNPEVQRLKLENYRLQKQIEQNYMKPDNYFKLEARPRRFEEDKRKDDQIRLLRKQLEIVRTECLKVGEKGSNFLDVQRYERLQKENEVLRQFVRGRTGKRPGYIPPAIRKLVGVGPEVNDRHSIQLPEVAMLNRTNAQLQRKVDDLNQQEQLILYQVQLREVSYQQAKQLNNQLREQYSKLTSGMVNPPDYDPLSERVLRLEGECARLRTHLQQQTIREDEINQRLRVTAQIHELNQQTMAMQAQEALQRREAEAVHAMNVMNIPPMAPSMIQQTVQQTAQFQQATQMQPQGMQPMPQPMQMPPPPPQQVSENMRMMYGASQQNLLQRGVSPASAAMPIEPAFLRGPPILLQEMQEQRVRQERAQEQARQRAEVQAQQQLAQRQYQQQQQVMREQQQQQLAMQQQQQQIAQQQQQQQQAQQHQAALQQQAQSNMVPPPQQMGSMPQPAPNSMIQLLPADGNRNFTTVHEQNFISSQPPSSIQPQSIHSHTVVQPGGPIVINLNDPAPDQLPMQPPQQFQPPQQSQPIQPHPSQIINQRTIISTETHERRIISGPANSPPPPSTGVPAPPAIAPNRNFNINDMFDS